MNTNKPLSRFIAMMLCFALVFTTAPIIATAEGNSGCTHAHDGSCSYVGSVDCGHQHDGLCGHADAARCGHQHEESCGEDGTACVHNHDTLCGYAEAAPCGHAEHDAGCGYAVAVPCDHQHDEHCGGISPILSLGYSVTAFDSLPHDVAAQSVPLGTTMNALALPDMLNATGEADNAQPEAIEIPGVTWQSAPNYEPDTADTYSFTAVLPQGYTEALPEKRTGDCFRKLTKS